VATVLGKQRFALYCLQASRSFVDTKHHALVANIGRNKRITADKSGEVASHPGASACHE